MKFLLIIVIVFVIVAAIVAASNSDSSSSVSSTRSDGVTYPPRSIHTGICDDDVMEVFIAGLGHHCNRRDIGPFSGVIFPETDNPVDKKAMAIGCHRRKKILGYVPNAILTDYRKWCKREKRPCAGYIYWDGEYLRGRCRVYPSNNEEDMDKFSEDATAYIKKVADHFGWDLNDDCSLK